MYCIRMYRLDKAEGLAQGGSGFRLRKNLIHEKDDESDEERNHLGIEHSAKCTQDPCAQSSLMIEEYMSLNAPRVTPADYTQAQPP